MKPSKPITQNMKDKANALYRIMQDGKWHTKEELGLLLGIKNERSVRDVISTLSKRKPIFSTSDNKGYIMPNVYSKELYDIAVHSWQEIDSRQQELEERKQPIIKFCEECIKKGLTL